MLQAFRIKISPTPYYSSSPGLAILLYESLRIIIYFLTLSRAADWPSRYGAPRRARAQARAMLCGAGGSYAADGHNPKVKAVNLTVFQNKKTLRYRIREFEMS